MDKPKFYQAELKEIEGDVLQHVYPFLKNKNGFGQFTLKERMGNDNAECSECGMNEWWIYPKQSVIVATGGKPYIECLNCGHVTHL
jgi:hypothetical protein